MNPLCSSFRPNKFYKKCLSWVHCNGICLMKSTQYQFNSKISHKACFEDIRVALDSVFPCQWAPNTNKNKELLSEEDDICVEHDWNQMLLTLSLCLLLLWELEVTARDPVHSVDAAPGPGSRTHAAWEGLRAQSGFKSTRGLLSGLFSTTHTPLETSERLMPASRPHPSLRGQRDQSRLF